MDEDQQFEPAPQSDNTILRLLLQKMEAQTDQLANLTQKVESVSHKHQPLPKSWSFRTTERTCKQLLGVTDILQGDFFSCLISVCVNIIFGSLCDPCRHRRRPAWSGNQHIEGDQIIDQMFDQV